MAGEIDTQALLTALLPDLHADSFADLTFWTEDDLIQWTDEACKRLARVSMTFVERDTSITTAGGTAIYSLPSRQVATLHISLGISPLRPAAVIDLEARDESFQSTPGTPDHWYEDDIMLGTVGLVPVPTAAAALPTICAVYPPDVDVAQDNTLVQAPAPLAGYLAFSVLAKAYGEEGESEQPELAKHCRARVQMYEQICQQYYGTL
jgi:hypothetical protein